MFLPALIMPDRLGLGPGWDGAEGADRFRRVVATRYDKRDRIYQGTIDVASIRIWLRDPVA
jgi:hypothetical protein